MSRIDTIDQRRALRRDDIGWRELWRKEDWWAIWLGLGIVALAYLFFANGSSIKWLAVTPPKWSSWTQLSAHFADNWQRYLAQFLGWLAVFTVALSALGHRIEQFIPSFVLLYVLSLGVFIGGQWATANYYGFEVPVVALLLGLVISNTVGLPRWLDSGFRVEFYVKTGIVLLGATLPFTLILWAGPVAILQAGIDSGEFCDVDARLTALAWLGMHNYTYLWLKAGGRLSARDVAKPFAEIFTRGIANPADG